VAFLLIIGLIAMLSSMENRGPLSHRYNPCPHGFYRKRDIKENTKG
jgi:hypothetical protein